MKVYKEKQFLVFDFEDGRTVKYDFAAKQAIGIKGKPVNDLRNQLRDYRINQIFDCCSDKQYAKFLRFVKRNESRSYPIENIGTILDRVPYYARFEQIFSAGIEEIIDEDYRFKYSISDIPKGLIKICKEHKVKLSNRFVENYKENPDAYLLAWNLDYISLDETDILSILTNKTNIKEDDNTRWCGYRYVEVSSFNYLLKRGYSAKALLKYADYCKTFEAIDDMNFLFTELIDYMRMMSELSNRYDKYPRNLLTTHRIASRNYLRLKKQFEEDKFKQRINKDYEYTYGDYKFIYPESTQDIKDEAASQNNCVASYIDSVIDGGCHILFLRKKNALEESLVTIEVRNNRIVQAKRKFNTLVTEEDQKAIDAWNKKFENYEKEKVA